LLDYLLPIVLGIPAFVPGIVLHEVAHGLVAERLGDPTARLAGRLTLNPKAHFDPLGALMFVMSSIAGFGFGWAKPVPINPFNFRDPRRDMAISSLAGPVSNILQLGFWAVLLRLVRGDIAATGNINAVYGIIRYQNDLLGYVIVMGMVINGALTGFNLIPIPPLDGSRVLAFILPERYAYMLDRLEPFGFVILLLALWLGLLEVVWPFIVRGINLFL
jgi:Zn-dependent protease